MEGTGPEAVHAPADDEALVVDGEGLAAAIAAVSAGSGSDTRWCRHASRTRNSASEGHREGRRRRRPVVQRGGRASVGGNLEASEAAPPATAAHARHVVRRADDLLRVLLMSAPKMSGSGVGGGIVPLAAAWLVGPASVAAASSAQPSVLMISVPRCIVASPRCRRHRGTVSEMPECMDLHELSCTGMAARPDDAALYGTGAAPSDASPMLWNSDERCPWIGERAPARGRGGALARAPRRPIWQPSLSRAQARR